MARVWAAFKKAFLTRGPCPATWGEGWKTIHCHLREGHKGRHWANTPGYFEW